MTVDDREEADRWKLPFAAINVVGIAGMHGLSSSGARANDDRAKDRGR